MKVMVVGGAGYIGSRLVPVLLEKGHKVTVIDLCWFGCNLPLETNVQIRDANTLSRKDFIGLDRVVMLSGLSNDPMADHDPVGNYIQNAAIPAFLAREARIAGVKRFILGSSCSVYGHKPEIETDEWGTVNCSYPYGVSKLMAETGCFAQDGDMEVVAIRKGTVCGPSPRMRYDLIINAMTKSAVTTNTITVNDPAAWRPILGIRSAVTSYVEAIEREKCSGVYLAVSFNAQVLDIAKSVGDVCKERLGIEPKIVIRNEKDLRSYRCRSQQKDPLTIGALNETVWSIANDVVDYLPTTPDLESPIYNNIATFRRVNP